MIKKKYINELDDNYGQLCKLYLQYGGFIWNDGLNDQEIKNSIILLAEEIVSLLANIVKAEGNNIIGVIRYRRNITLKKLERRNPGPGTGELVHALESISNSSLSTFNEIKEEAIILNDLFEQQGTRRWGDDQKMIEIAFQINCLKNATSREEIWKETADILSPLIFLIAGMDEFIEIRVPDENPAP